MEPTDFEYGERQYSAADPAGHVWTFSETLADVAPEEWGGTSVSRLTGGVASAAMPIGKAGNPVSHISQAYPDRVEVRGRDLTGDLMGRLSFTEYFHLLLTGEEPTEEQRFFLDLLLVAIAEHGMMPTNVAARMTLAADPGSLQGAVAAGILGCGPVILGTAESCARLLEAAQEKVAAGGEPAAVGAEVAREVTPPAPSCRASAIRCTGRSIRAPSGSSSWRMTAGRAAPTCCWRAASATASRRPGASRSR